MSWHAVSWAKAQKTGSPARKVTLMCLAEHANEQGEAWPSRDRLSRDTEQSVDTVDRRLAELIEGGFITKELRREAGRQATSVYRLNFDLEAQEKHLQGNRLTKRAGPQVAALAPEPQTEPQTEPQLCGPNQRTIEPIPYPRPRPEGTGGKIFFRSSLEPDLAAICEAVMVPGAILETVVRRRLEKGWIVEAPGKVPRGDDRNAKVAVHAARLTGQPLDVAFVRVGPEADVKRLGAYGGLKIGVAERSWLVACPEGLDALIVLEQVPAPAGAAKSAAAGPVPSVWVREGTPQWHRWAEHYRRQGKKLVAIGSKYNPGQGMVMPSEWPPGSSVQHPPPAARASAELPALL